MKPQSGPAILDYDSNKPDQYFVGARVDWIDQLPVGKDLHILELGCGHGMTGKYAFTKNVCSHYAGIEIAANAADVARQSLSEVVVGNVETIELPFQPGQFDALLMSEVLEHLVDPWAVLDRLMVFLKPGAHVFASSPNVAHIAILKKLIRGRWDLTDYGAMDRTHLRWFTLETYREMFEGAGVRVETVASLNTRRTRKQRLFMRATGGRYDHLFTYQINLIGRKR